MLEGCEEKETLLYCWREMSIGAAALEYKGRGSLKNKNRTTI